MKLCRKYMHVLLLPVFGFFYLLGFYYLENTIKVPKYTIHLSVDDMIPFIPCFIIPYLLWFAYVSVSVLYFLWKDKQEYLRLMYVLMFGMTLFLIVSALFPNGHNLRPRLYYGESIFTDLIIRLYKTDTPTNILPSIHVFNSLAVCCSVFKYNRFKHKRFIDLSSFILCTSIILSTMFIKQHSMLDVILAIVLFTIIYPVFYCQDSTVYYKNIQLLYHSRRKIRQHSFYKN